MRGRALLNLSERVTGGKRLQRVLPFPWEAPARQDIHTAVLAIHASFARGIPLDQCIALATGSASPAEDDSTPEEVVEPIQAMDWQGLVAQYREHKISSGLIKQTTWERTYAARMQRLVEATKGKTKPSTPRQLLELLTQRLKDQPGSRGRQVVVQQAAALLRWAVDNERLPQEWAPPLVLSSYTGRRREPKSVTTPIGVDDILLLVESIPDSRWRYAVQLLASFGLRPEELQHLELREGRLWCNYAKVSSRGSTRPRPLRVLPCDAWAKQWGLEESFSSTRMPPMRPGFGSQDLKNYLRRRPLWDQLRHRYALDGEKLVLYSCRHGYAHRAHVICELPPKVVAAAMGHTVETHLAAYSKWCGDDVVDDAFDKAARLLGDRQAQAPEPTT